MTWVRLDEATVLLDHDVQKGRERLARAITKAWLVLSPGFPQQTFDPNVPLRIQLTLPAGVRIYGRAWLDKPILDWETSEIECLGKPWTPLSQASLPTDSTQYRTKIEIWSDDLVRLWGSHSSASQSKLTAATAGCS